MGTGAQVELVRYYELPLHPPSATISAEQATKRFLDLFTESVRLQLHADVPVGISLSGGIDSSAIVCAASRCRGSTDGLTAITISWPDTVSEEVACAKELCQKLGMAHEVVEPATEKDVDLPLLAWISDEPIADPATYSQFLVGKLPGSASRCCSAAPAGMSCLPDMAIMRLVGRSRRTRCCRQACSSSYMRGRSIAGWTKTQRKR